MVEEKIIFKGISAYPGVVYGQVYKWKPHKKKREARTGLSPAETRAELELFKASLKKTELELSSFIQVCSHDPNQKELTEILESQIVFLNDPIFRARVVERMQLSFESANLALETAVSSLYEEFQSIEDPYFRERADHLLDIGKRLEKNLSASEPADPNQNLPLSYILVAKEITPSEMITLDKTRIIGIATDYGGKTGHMAIIARNFGIPTIVGLKNITSHVDDDDYVLLDSVKGEINRFPKFDDIKLYGVQSEFKTPLPTEDTLKQLLTKDGHPFLLKVNIDSLEEVALAAEKGADGIGLVRTEILFIQHKDQKPTEEEQFQIYKQILLRMESKPVNFRVWDIGADKMENGYEESNPFLGNRGIRYLLRHPHFFKEQIRALLRASEYGTMSVMLPMITTLAEILQTKVLWNQCIEELKEQGLEINKSIPFGIMVETPACALNLPFIGKHIDFYSVGTNDLLQYLLAVERNNHTVNDLYNPWQVVFLLLLKNIAEVAKSQKRPVSICGEIGSDPMFTSVLIGLGYRDLSCALPLLKKVRSKVKECSTWKSKLLAEQVIDLAAEERYTEIESLVNQTIG
ncbi:phosphoenolpyruvate--protein phosphotransferase [Leptospira ognonensis]|uniref:Phosphoenolpyruvate-protein phosphotransferase n=1 Tax=Leptospira ognonensis TaxID=2484945 RepID=A0A4R9K800_9LEPT|nr:phosphoenolpyruvate--protein phosphotransferase [Leptospira ognonensis]TGL62727.1 phosphoenolpyruvate--protein phosphotransferase [Leptospira ognonensis]